MFIDIRNLQERRQARDSQFEDTRDIRNGYLFEVNGSVEGDRDGLVWFKALDGNSAPFQVFYDGIIGDLRANMYVKIERKPKDPARWQIKEFYTNIYFDDQSAYEQLPSTSMIPKKEDYEWPPGFPGAKALNIFPRAITEFAVRPTSPASMKARVYSGIYPGATNYARFQGPVNTKDFTADVPGAGLARLAAISIDNSGTLNYTNGTTFVDGLPMPDASLPAVPASQMLISAIRLVNGMTAIEESNFDLEMRPLMANSTVNLKVSEIWDSNFGNVAAEADADGNILASATMSADNYAFIVENTSGATASANDVGYIDEAGEYKTTTTAQASVTWCVVITGGANNADIYVARRGRATIAYTGGAPSAGDYLVTSTSAGDAQAQTTMRPEIFAIALAGGAGGIVDALLLTGRTPIGFFSEKNYLFINLAGISDFVSTIAAAGVIGDKIYYNAPSSGSVSAINPFATNDLAKIIIHNTTTGGNAEARIIDTGTDGTGNFIQVSASSDISGWVATEAITARSQTNTSSVGTSYFFDLEITDSDVNELTTDILFTGSYRDTGGVSLFLRTHPFQTNVGSKRITSLSTSTTDNSEYMHEQPLLQQRICVLWEASGAATAIPLLRIRQTIVATP